MENTDYVVVKYSQGNEFISIVAGMGRNKNTWDTNHGRRTAQRHAKALRAEDPQHIYRVETAN